MRALADIEHSLAHGCPPQRRSSPTRPLPADDVGEGEVLTLGSLLSRVVLEARISMRRRFLMRAVDTRHLGQTDTHRERERERERNVKGERKKGREREGKRKIEVGAEK